MGSFLVASYKVRLELQRSGNPIVTTRNRILEITSVLETHGIVETALLVFSTSWDNWAGSPVVGFLNSTNLLQPVMAGWLPSSEFSFWYDLLRSEKPLTFSYDVTLI